MEFICGQQLTESVDVLSILSTQAMQRFDTFAWFLLKNQTKLNIALALGFDWFITLASWVGSEATSSRNILEGTAVKKSFPSTANQVGMKVAVDMAVKTVHKLWTSRFLPIFFPDTVFLERMPLG